MALFKRKKSAQSSDTTGEKKQGQLAVLKDALRLTREEKPSALILMALIFIAVLVCGILIGSKLGHPVYFAIVSIPVAILGAFFYFSRQANSAAFASIEGQIGAGASVLMAIRKGFTTTPAVNVARNQDMVHRSVGRPGIVLVAEGSPAVRSMLQDERKKMERFVPGVPVIEIIVGDEKGQVPLRKLQKSLKKLPNKLSKVQLREVRSRVKAVGGLQMPIPKGPMPMNRNVKMPKR
jgi:Domain of unknown function (DUF4191)